jgi:hypothetical protein
LRGDVSGAREEWLHGKFPFAGNEARENLGGVLPSPEAPGRIGRDERDDAERGPRDDLDEKPG